MKILLSNKFYYHRGGSETYIINLEELLKSKGHDVAVFAMQHPQGMESSFSQYFPANVEYGKRDLKQICLFLTRPFGTKEVKRKFNALLDDFQPNVVHFNNIHTHLSPVIMQIAHERGVKVVWTLHDMKIICPDTLCLRSDGQICELCFYDKRYVLKHKCNKKSFGASLIAYLEAKKWTRKKLEKYTNTFISPSKFLADKLKLAGFDENKISVLCNFIDIEKTKKENQNREDYYCYIGRLSREKGIETLIEAAKKLPFHLKIIGGGPLLEELQQSIKNENIEFLGYKQWGEIKEIVGKARFLVIPSEWYENNPLSVIESKCLGTPILGANIGGIPELIEEGKSGMLFESRNVSDLREKIEKMFEMNFDYKKIAEESQQCYSSENYYQKIMKIYRKSINNC